MTTVKPNTVVTLHYVLTDESGVQHEDTRSGEPISYLHGTKALVIGLEKAMNDRVAGDEFEVDLSPAEAFGLKQRYRIKHLPRSMFSSDFPAEIGTPYLIDEGNGEHRMYWIAAATDETISLQQNHPLAGVVVRFWVQICAVRQASEAELIDGCAYL
jgi:FKBP-type peptidyl-prolyl cis-trans isomerase SlyD